MSCNSVPCWSGELLHVGRGGKNLVITQFWFIVFNVMLCEVESSMKRGKCVRRHETTNSLKERKKERNTPGLPSLNNFPTLIFDLRWEKGPEVPCISYPTPVLCCKARLLHKALRRIQ